MRRVAASSVYVNGKEFHNHVVELIDHLVVNHYPLEEELPMTEWLGGTIIIRGNQAYHTPHILTPEEAETFKTQHPHSSTHTLAERRRDCVIREVIHKL